MRSEVEADQTQRRYARLAGYLYLWVIAVAVIGSLISSHVAGSGTLTETATRIAASEHLYRLGLVMMVVGTLGSIVLAFALYGTLKAVSSLLALLGMVFSLSDCFLAMVVRMCGFVKLYLALSAWNPAGTVDMQSLWPLVNNFATTTDDCPFSRTVSLAPIISEEQTSLEPGKRRTYQHTKRSVVTGT